MLEDIDFWRNYMTIYRPHLLYHIPYTPYLLPLYEVIEMKLLPRKFLPQPYQNSLVDQHAASICRQFR
jgi:hypothetical protein